MTLTLLAFIGLVWLREQILHGGGPEWLDHEIQLAAAAQQQQQQQGQGGEAAAAAAAAVPPADGDQANEEENNEEGGQQQQQGPVFGPMWEDMDDEVSKLGTR